MKKLLLILGILFVGQLGTSWAQQGSPVSVTNYKQIAFPNGTPTTAPTPTKTFTPGPTSTFTFTPTITLSPTITSTPTPQTQVPAGATHYVVSDSQKFGYAGQTDFLEIGTTTTKVIYIEKVVMDFSVSYPITINSPLDLQNVKWGPNSSSVTNGFQIPVTATNLTGNGNVSTAAVTEYSTNTFPTPAPTVSGAGFTSGLFGSMTQPIKQNSFLQIYPFTALSTPVATTGNYGFPNGATATSPLILFDDQGGTNPILIRGAGNFVHFSTGGTNSFASNETYYFSVYYAEN